MPDALLAVRCMGCGWVLLSRPDFAPRADRWLECANPNCPENGKRYALPTVPLKSYVEKHGA